MARQTVRAALLIALVFMASCASAFSASSTVPQALAEPQEADAQIGRELLSKLSSANADLRLKVQRELRAREKTALRTRHLLQEAPAAAPAEEPLVAPVPEIAPTPAEAPAEAPIPVDAPLPATAPLPIDAPLPATAPLPAEVPALAPTPATDAPVPADGPLTVDDPLATFPPPAPTVDESSPQTTDAAAQHGAVALWTSLSLGLIYLLAF